MLSSKYRRNENFYCAMLSPFLDLTKKPILWSPFSPLLSSDQLMFNQVKNRLYAIEDELDTGKSAG